LKKEIMKNKSFTLIEMLVIIVIIGLLVGVIITATSSYIEEANRAKSISFSNKIEKEHSLDSGVLEWNLNESSGSVASDLWGSKNGTLNYFNFDTNSGWRSGDECVLGGCLQFDGVDDYLLGDTKLTDYTKPIVIELWLKIPSSFTWINGTIAMLSTNTSYGMGIFRYANNNVLIFASRIGSVSVYGTQSYAIKRDTYYHLVFAGNGTSFDAYVNGQKINTSSPAYGILSGSYLTGVFRVGNRTIYGGDGGGYLKGNIDEIRVYNSLLSAYQIKRNYIIGLNSLLAYGELTEDEYNERIGQLAQN
ncbi:MAG: prepilin-type N-terminal cleavage/methylation domain-containing protein, partial [Candidatus Pacebacteria bacterium]|nr:prepilin-type N-terminal cleavage/methylation domain-containing protein [Candidatus Paceibacterota bacterium]